MTRTEETQSWGDRLPGARAMWPGATRRLTRRPVRRGSLLVLPRTGSPRMLVPADVRGAHLMLKRHATGRVQRVTQELLVVAQRMGVLGLLPLERLVPADGGPTIEDHVRAHVPDARSVGVLLGPPRANAKPVLQVFDGTGRTIAFGKLGHDATSAGLVRAEARVLRELADRRLTTVEVPTLISCAAWNGMDLLLMTALSASQQRASSWELPVDAMVEVAEEPGFATETVVDGSYVAALRGRVGSTGQSRRVALLDELTASAAGVELRLGRWHGDWAPWNMAHAAGRVQVWDWERSVTGVPVGLDVAHFQVQREIQLGSSPEAAVDASLAAVVTTTRRWGYGPEQAAATLLLYLIEVLDRYATTGGATPTPALRRRTDVLERMADLAVHQHWRN